MLIFSQDSRKLANVTNYSRAISRARNHKDARINYELAFDFNAK